MGGAKRFITIILIFVGLILLSGATFTIDEKEQAIITQFGKYIRTIKEPGLYFKIPIIQTLHLFEKRVLTTDALAAVEYITSTKRGWWWIMSPDGKLKTLWNSIGVSERRQGRWHDWRISWLPG